MAKTQEEAWEEELPQLVRGSQALQYFFQTFFEDSGLFSLAPPDKESLARFEGRRDVALNVKEHFDRLDHELFHQIMYARQVNLAQATTEEESD